uniref:PARP-type domain-containing protein n=1 Tax=Eutreptiella gymnastica TaxID=73025 RepID=A0A7S4FSB7_9EUGL
MAKTGQSRCRKCADPIPKGELRVGLEAWISGRKAVTWQHPPCFLQGLRFAAATTGRSKCKATGDLMPKGAARLGLTSHTTTHWVGLEALPAVLEKISTGLHSPLALEEVEGFATLAPPEQQRVRDLCPAGPAAPRAAVKAQPHDDLKTAPEAAPAPVPIRTTKRPKSDAGPEKEGTPKKPRVATARGALVAQYLELTRERLPALAAAHGWCLRLDHCFQRVVLDTHFGCCWYERLDQRRGAVHGMSAEQLAGCIAVAERLLRDPSGAVLAELNAKSLEYRGKGRAGSAPAGAVPNDAA